MIAGSVYELSHNDPPYVPWFNLAGNAGMTVLNACVLFVLVRRRERVAWSAVNVIASGLSALYVACVAGVCTYLALAR